MKLIATYQTDDFPGITHVAVHHFVDLAPDFEISGGIIEAYADFPGVYFEINHGDLPSSEGKPITHRPSPRAIH